MVAYSSYQPLRTTIEQKIAKPAKWFGATNKLRRRCHSAMQRNRLGATHRVRHVGLQRVPDGAQRRVFVIFAVFCSNKELSAVSSLACPSGRRRGQQTTD